MANSIKTCTTRRKFALGGTISFLLGVVVMLAMPAHAQKPTTWIVIDAGSGQVLNERDPDGLNYPASLTKIMTLFLTFDALERHRIDLSQRFYVSEHAALQHPSKLGMLPGSTIAVRDLILAVVTHSANDAAVVLAEGLGGTESAFAARMNAQAQALGMTRTNFRNASGLPDPLQYTTARDLAKLALALWRRFPREYRFFATEEFDYNGAIYTNHNRLMAAFEGMDGIKTGWINASGFNLAASAVRDNRRLIGVLLGGRTPQSRDMDMAELLDDAFAHRPPSSPGDVAVASNDGSDERDTGTFRDERDTGTFRDERDSGTFQDNRDGGTFQDNVDADASAISPDTAASTLNAGADFHQPVFRSARAHLYRHRHSRHVREASHRRLRHGVVRARAEMSRRNFRRHRINHRYAAAGRRHYHQVAAVRRHALRVKFAEAHHRDRRASSAGGRMHHAHGAACGGWNGSTRPCPASYGRRPHGRSA